LSKLPMSFRFMDGEMKITKMFIVFERIYMIWCTSMIRLFLCYINLN
jgi:hypothetical protein